MIGILAQKGAPGGRGEGFVRDWRVLAAGGGERQPQRRREAEKTQSWSWCGGEKTSSRGRSGQPQTKDRRRDGAKGEGGGSSADWANYADGTRGRRKAGIEGLRDRGTKGRRTGAGGGGELRVASSE